MSQPSYVEGPTRTFTADGAIAQNLRVKLSSGQASLAGDEDDIGVLENESYAASDEVAVRLNNAPGTRIMVAAGAIAVGAEVFAAAGGKVDDTGTRSRGTALTATSADGEELEVLPA